MNIYGVIFGFVLWSIQCSGRTVTPEDSVVSVYTTQPTTATASLDVYHQIANNIAERITSPIYRFLGIGKNKTTTAEDVNTKTKSVEILEVPETKDFFVPATNEISETRDVEELSAEALKKIEDKKPEKITLYSYLPTKENLDKNETSNDIDDDPFEFDDDDDETDEPTGFSYYWELFSSLFQLLWGALVGYFTPKTSS